MNTSIKITIKVLGFVPSVFLNLALISAGTGVALSAGKNLVTICSNVMKTEL
ncbi:MAG: hypothetical protein K0R00_47 [Herbinix sp.]|jgi:hypothetical protein|nr:hypothetical protein [Herbinix sp.]